MAENSNSDVAADSSSHEAIIPFLFDGKKHFPGKQQLASSRQVFEVVERKTSLVPLDDDPLQREWDDFIEEFPQCNRYLEPDFIERNFPSLRQRLGGAEAAGASGDDKDRILIYDVDVQQFPPENIKVSVKEGNVSVLGRTEEILNGGGRYLKKELLGAMKVPDEVETNDVDVEVTPEQRLKISRPASAMSSAPSSAENSLAER